MAERDKDVEDLQAVSAHILTMVERIRQLEDEKRTVEPGTDRFLALSDEIEALGEEIRAVSHAETGLAEALVGEPGLPTVAEADEHSTP